MLAALLIGSVGCNVYLFVAMASGVSFGAGIAAENHTIQNVTSLISMVGTIVGAIGLLIGVDQLRQAKNQSRAQAIYTALKDARELQASVSEGERFNLYYALFEQKRLDVFTDEMWAPVRLDIESALTQSAAQAYWQGHKANYPREFRDELATIPGGK
ncbi:hypothetical protein [Emcibacter sp. SYSU 3D8]|uniref:hypothetical protein n=1 Tax=Emcibacter sp. SYSU 3D8 TaxID=3133969 RepID=UPI0031FE7EF9